jgi:large subunit ribosomal protein L15
MQLHELRSPRGARKLRKLVGRGRGSGHGKTSCRGQKGQKARSGPGMKGSLEGGQMSIIRRLPKVGFHSARPIVYQIVKLSELAKFKDGSVVDAKTLKAKGIIEKPHKPYKILADGELKKALTIQAYSFSKQAEEQIKQAGGTIQTITASAVMNDGSSQKQKSK